MRRTELTIEQILAWADAYYQRTGHWPNLNSGRVWEPPDEKWLNIDTALRMGLRGLLRGLSLAKLLAKYRGRRNRKALPPYTIAQILKWADAHHARTGHWPHRFDGPIPNTNGETWAAVEMALNHGQRGMPGGSSLAQLLAAKRGVKNKQIRPRLTVKQILLWADEYKKRTGNWPTAESGPIPGSDDDTWLAIDLSLRQGHRGLSRSSLAKLLQKYRGVPLKYRRLPPLTIKQILAWGDEYFARTGKWPLTASGPIDGTIGETWNRVQNALQKGTRGLPGGMSLSELWTTQRGARIHLALPPHTEPLILQWAKAHKREHGSWPNRNSGPIPGTHGETWSGVSVALNHAKRGLKRRTSLKKLIDANC
jgi:hypothetical protein